MDKVKIYLAVLKQRHFWVLCGVILLLSYFSWSAGKAYFSEEYDDQRRKLEGKFSALQTIINTPNHPNQSFAEESTELATDLKKKTLEAWQSVYDAQKQELDWIKDPLDWGVFPPDGELPPSVLDQFRQGDYHTQYVPQLFTDEVIRLVRSDPRSGVVYWDESKRSKIVDRYKWVSRPTSKAVLLAQEDYWIYRAVLSTIEAANADATANYQATVKEIRELEIAQDALAGLANQAVKVANVNSDAVVRETSEPPTVPTPASSDEELDAGRYASPAAPPVSAGGDPGMGSGAPGVGGAAQYKLVPVRMTLVVQEAKLPVLLAACANAKLPIEVRQCLIREIAPEKVAAAPAGSGGGSKPEDKSPVVIEKGDVEVDLYGVIYLYNPPSPEALGLPAEELEGESGAEEGI